MRLSDCEMNVWWIVALESRTPFWTDWTLDQKISPHFSHNCQPLSQTVQNHTLWRGLKTHVCWQVCYLCLLSKLGECFLEGHWGLETQPEPCNEALGLFELTPLRTTGSPRKLWSEHHVYPSETPSHLAEHPGNSHRKIDSFNVFEDLWNI